MTNESESETGDTSLTDIESGISAIQELVPDMDEAAIRQTLEHMASAQNVDLGTCAQIVRNELEAGRLPVEQFKSHLTS